MIFVFRLLARASLATLHRLGALLGWLTWLASPTYRRHLRGNMALALGADFAYIGSAFIATQEAHAIDAYKQAIVQGHAEDIVYTDYFTGVHGNYLRPSILAAGLDPDHLPESDPNRMNFSSNANQAAKAWKDIWGSGQGIGAVDAVVSSADLIERLKREYAEAKAALCA